MWLSGDFYTFLNTYIWSLPYIEIYLCFFSLSIDCDVNNKTGFCIRLNDWIIIRAARIELTTSNDL